MMLRVGRKNDMKAPGTDSSPAEQDLTPVGPGK